jgi:predicted MFS family arabinose efflux permease
MTRYWRLLKSNRNYRFLWLGQVVSESGDWLYAVVLYSLLLEYTGKAESVGFALVCQVLPQVFVSPVAGVLNDRISRRQIMIAVDILRFFIMAGFLLVRSPEMIWLVWILLCLETMMWGFFEPARSAIVPIITGNEEDKLTANTLSSITWSACFFMGSSLGGWIAAYMGRDFVFGLDALTFLVSAWFISRMRFEEPHTEAHAGFRWRDLFDFRPVLEGVRYIAGHPRRRVLIFAKAGVGLLGSNYVILTLLGERDFPLTWAGRTAAEAGMLGISALMAARGVGAIVGPLTSTSICGSREPRMRIAIACGFLLVLFGYAALSQSASYWSAFPAVMFAHAGASTVWVLTATLLQTYSKDEYRGRVMAADFAALTISISVSSYLAGRSADAGVSIRTVALATGLIMLVPFSFWLWATRRWSEREQSPLPPSAA